MSHRTPRKKTTSARHRRSLVNSLGLIFLGAGLILVGIVALVVLNRPQSAPAEEPSAIPAQVSFAAPELSLSDLQNQTHALSDYRGQVVLVNLWATWCPPCKAEMPTLDAYYRDHKDSGFVLLAINAGDPAEAVRQFVTDYRLSLPIWLDPENRASRAFQVMSYPSSFVIDRQGTVRLAWVGAITRTMLEKYVTPLIGE